MATEPNLLQEISSWVSLLQIPVWGVVVWGWWSLKRVFVKQSDCAVCRQKIEERHAELDRKHEENKLAKEALSQKLSGLPTVHDLHRIELNLSELSGDVKRVCSELEALRSEQAHTRNQFDDLLQLHMKPGA